MNRTQLEHALRAAGAIADDHELYVVGSQSILGAHPNAPAELLRSMEVDIAPKNKPELEELVEGSIGELSPFHSTHGFYVDGVEIAHIVLPEGWKQRVVVVDNSNTNGVRGLCLHPSDLAISKLAAGRPKDLAFVRVLLREKYVHIQSLKELLARVPSLATEEMRRLQELLSTL